jgi:hypothetical protein
VEIQVADTSGNTGGDTGGNTGGNTGGDTSGNTGGTGSSSTSYCEAPVKHMLVDAETASEVNLTIERIDVNTVDVSVVSTDADPVDLVLVGAQTW